MKGLPAFCFVVLSFGIIGAFDSMDGLRYNYYSETCPRAEAIIADMMAGSIDEDNRLPARMIRMHFHDCFVRGCDASVLIDSTPTNKAEKDAGPNNPSLKGFELIDQMKEVLENECPGVVSCADIVTYAARESVHKSGHFERYDVRGGRKDGRISLESEVLNDLPTPLFDVNLLVTRFASKGLSLEDMVTLSGAHSIGVSHCSSIFDRQENFNNTGAPDPNLDFVLASKLRSECPSAGKSDPTVVMDTITPTILDHHYYRGILLKKGLFTSDQTLLTSELTKNQVMVYANDPSAWEKKFVDAMIKMGEIEVLTGDKGEIRRKCGFVNHEWEG